MEELFDTLQDDTQSLWLNPQSSVRRLRQMPSPITFFKDYVATSTPVIIEGGAANWNAAKSWDLESLSMANPELEVCRVLHELSSNLCNCTVGQTDRWSLRRYRQPARFVFEFKPPNNYYNSSCSDDVATSRVHDEHVQVGTG